MAVLQKYALHGLYECNRSLQCLLSVDQVVGKVQGAKLKIPYTRTWLYQAMRPPVLLVAVPRLRIVVNLCNDYLQIGMICRMTL